MRISAGIIELNCVQKFWKNGNLWCEEFRNSDGQYHNDAGPAYRQWHENGKLVYESYWLNGKLHNASGPAICRWRENGQREHEEYLLNGKYHNAAGPAVQHWNENGVLKYEEYWLDGHNLAKAYWETLV